MKRVTYIIFTVIFICVLFTQCNTPKHTMTVAQIPTVAPKPTTKVADSTHYIIVPPKPKPTIPTNPKDNFEQSFVALKEMLQGATTPDFERAVFLSENPYHNNKYSYQEFQQMVDEQLTIIQKLIEANDKSDTMNFDAHVGANGKFKMADMRFLPKEKKELYRKALSNWAIFTYITDTLTIRIKDSTNIYSFYHLPFTYTTQDPFGKNDWTNTQVINLLTKGEQGNCFSLTAFFKILSNRLNTGTRLCTAPQHIYLQHRDTRGDYYNVELATAGFPRDGTLQTLTYTTNDALMNKIALRDYTEQQSIGLCIINLAKSYEHYFKTQTDTFLLQCAEAVLQYDSLNLSALLLKQQVLDERVAQYAKEKSISNIASLKQDKNIQSTVYDLEKHTTLLYRLGYRQMPVDMQQIILSGNYPTEFEDQNPKPYTNPQISKDDKLNKYQALYGGLFKEVFVEQPTEEYRHFTFDTKTKQLKSINLNALDNELIDPVAFAYDFGARFYDARVGRFLSTDPAFQKYPSHSPYNFVANNPIYYVDINGKWLGVTFIYGETSVGAGVGYGVYFVEQSGLAKDDVGRTHFTTRTFLHISNQNLKYGSSNPNFVAGADLNIISGKIKQNHKADTYLEAIGMSAIDFESPVGANTKLKPEIPSAKIGFGFSVGASKNDFTIGFGLEAGYTFTVMSEEILESISLTNSEANAINAQSKLIAKYWSVNNNNVIPNTDNSGKITNYTSTVMIQTTDNYGNTIQQNTGLKVTSGVKYDKNGNPTSNNVWATDNYIKQAKIVEVNK